MKAVNALIVGVNGQDGFYLSELLKKKGIVVIGLSRSNAGNTGSVSDISLIENLIKNHQPQYIFHLAANSTTRHDALFENHETISTGTLNILESVRLHCPQAKIFLSGSAMQFKNEGLPIDESTSFEASSPYSIARIQSVYAGRYFRKKFGLNVYVGYFFNHDSPLRSENHVNQKIVRAVQRISAGSNESLELGSIDVKKEFSFAGDIAEAIWLLVNQNKTYEAVIGSGKAYSIREWTAYCFKTVSLNFITMQFPNNNVLPRLQQ